MTDKLGHLSSDEIENRITQKASDTKQITCSGDYEEGWKDALEWVLALVRAKS